MTGASAAPGAAVRTSTPTLVLFLLRLSKVAVMRFGWGARIKVMGMGGGWPALRKTRVAMREKTGGGCAGLGAGVIVAGARVGVGGAVGAGAGIHVAVGDGLGSGSGVGCGAHAQSMPRNNAASDTPEQTRFNITTIFARNPERKNRPDSARGPNRGEHSRNPLSEPLGYVKRGAAENGFLISLI